MSDGNPYTDDAALQVAKIAFEAAKKMGDHGRLFWKDEMRRVANMSRFRRFLYHLFEYSEADLWHNASAETMAERITRFTMERLQS